MVINTALQSTNHVLFYIITIIIHKDYYNTLHLLQNIHCWLV